MTFIFINVEAITKRQMQAYIKKEGWTRIKKRTNYNKTLYMCSWVDMPLYIDWKSFNFTQEQIVSQVAEAHGYTTLEAYLKIIGKRIIDERR